MYAEGMSVLSYIYDMYVTGNCMYFMYAKGLAVAVNTAVNGFCD